MTEHGHVSKNLISYEVLSIFATLEQKITLDSILYVTTTYLSINYNEPFRLLLLCPHRFTVMS